MITAEVLNADGTLVYTINIFAEYYLALILGAITALAFWLMMKTR